jgi:Bcr/CflA subfamily drug resistance transporter
MRSLRAIFFLSVLFASVGTVSVDLYLPSLPAIANSLHTTISLTQLSVALFILGLSIARLTVATISDAVGRKMPIIISLVICLGGCFLCLCANNIQVLLLGRFLQGFGAGGSNILARIILRDCAEDTRLAEYNSYFSMVGVSLMAIAPLLGGYLQHYFGWRANFVVLLFYTVIALLCGIFFLPETNKYRNVGCLKPIVFKSSVKALFVDKSFIIYALLLMFGYGSLLAWLTAGPIVLQKVMLLTPVGFGWCAAVVGFCYFIGAFINSKLVGKVGIQKMLQFGVTCFFISGIVMLITVLVFHRISTVAFVGPVMFAFFGVSMLIPNSYAAGLTPFAKTAGIAVAILGSIQILGGVISSTFISFVSNQSQLPVAIVIFVSALVCIVLVNLLRKNHIKVKSKFDESWIGDES